MSSAVPCILLVDDYKENLQVVGTILEEAGYEIAIANTGEAALAQIPKTQPDLILLDIMMPGIDGFEVCRQLKQDSSTRDIPVIFLTAKVQPEDMVQGLLAGGVDYIRKPFNHMELLARVQTHLGLSKSRQQLQQLNETKDLFFSIIAHDLKGSLSGIVDLSSLTIEELASDTLEESIENLRLINRSAKNLYNLLGNLLDWARIQNGSLRCEPELLDLAEVVDLVQGYLEQRLVSKEISLAITLDSPATVFADRDMLRTILRNLLSNAIKFSHKGSSIELTSHIQGNTCEICVQDHGVGIEPNRIATLFEIGKKQSTPGTANEAGTGLGLILCKQFIEKNNGQIRVQSTPGQGTRFCITLPLKG